MVNVKCVSPLSPSDPPTISDLDDKQILEGDSLNVTCQYIPGDPPSTDVTWTNPFGDVVSETSVLVLENVIREDDGIYTCTATNSMVPSSGVPRDGVAIKQFSMDVQCMLDSKIFFSRNKLLWIKEELGD